jgi:hypothetical protein
MRLLSEAKTLKIRSGSRSLGAFPSHVVRSASGQYQSDFVSRFIDDRGYRGGRLAH